MPNISSKNIIAKAKIPVTENKPQENQEAVILYDSHNDAAVKEPEVKPEEEKKGKSAWWKKLIKG